MTVKHTTTDLPKEVIMDDVSDKEETKMNETVKAAAPDAVDEEKLAKLKAKLEAGKNKEVKKVVEKSRTLRLGVIGSGQGGSRVAEAYYKLKYDAVVMNTTNADLSHIEIPASNKLLLEYSLGGAAKSLEIGRDAAEHNRDKILELVSTHLADTQMFILCSSLGGGSGAGSLPVLIDILTTLGKPIIVMGILPMQSDDMLSKSNSLTALNGLLKQVQNKQICNLIVVDNAKIETIFKDVGQMDFFRTSNEAIVAPIDAFNMFSAQPSNVKSLDSMEFVKLLADGNGLSIFGQFNVYNYAEDETSIAEAVSQSLDNNLLAGGFDIETARYIGVIFTANKKTWAQIPSSSINYAMSIIGDKKAPLATFKGIYETDDEEDCVKVYSFFSGLGVPDARVSQLKTEIKSNEEITKNKDIKRNLTLNIDDGQDKAVSDAQKIKDKIASKNSIFGKFLQANTVDRRKS